MPNPKSYPIARPSEPSSHLRKNASKLFGLEFRAELEIKRLSFFSALLTSNSLQNGEQFLLSHAEYGKTTHTSFLTRFPRPRVIWECMSALFFLSVSTSTRVSLANQKHVSQCMKQNHLTSLFEELCMDDVCLLFWSCCSG